MRNRCLYNFTEYVFLISHAANVDELKFIDECIIEDMDHLNPDEMTELCDLMEFKLKLL